VRARLARERHQANSQRQRFESASRAADFHLETPGWRFQSDKSPGTAGRFAINPKNGSKPRPESVEDGADRIERVAIRLRSARLDDLLPLQGE
jgi:hypothetical protein